MEKNKSFTKILKRRSPRTDTCCKPVLISHYELKDEQIFILILLLVTYVVYNSML